MTPEVKQFMKELGFEQRGCVGQEYYAEINGRYVSINSHLATFFYHQFRLRELKARASELKRVGCCDYWDETSDLDVCRGDHHVRIADLNNQIADLETNK